LAGIKKLFNKTNPADANPIDIAARCLLIEDGNQLILILEWETNSLKNFMGTIRLGTHSLDNSLAKYGFHRDDITDVFIPTFAF
jgi:hypothetical protein